MKFNKNEFGWKEKVNINTDELVTKNDIPHYNETLMFEISGEDFKSFANNSYFNMSALNIDETKSYIVKNKFDINDDEEYTFEFIYNKENDVLINEDNQLHIYNHKSYNGTNLIEDVNSAVLTNNNNITPMTIGGFEGEGYFRLYEIDKVELDGNCLPKDVNISNSLTVGTRIGDIGIYSVAEGEETTASGECSHAEGSYTTAIGNVSHAEGAYTTAIGNISHAEGGYTTASGDFSHAEGNSFDLATDVIQDLSSSTSNDDILTAWNNRQFSLAKGNASHVEGRNCLALGDNSHAEGSNTTASGVVSHAEGESTIASGVVSHAEGFNTRAGGNSSHAEGFNTRAGGNSSHAEGFNTRASSGNQHVQGKYNIEDTTGTYAHIVGNGSSETSRSNAHTLDWNGNAWFKGKLSQDGTPTEDKDLTTKKYVDDKAIVEQIPILRIDEDNKIVYVNCNEMGTYKKYFVPNKYANVYSFSFVYTNDDNTETEIVRVGGALTRDDFVICSRNTSSQLVLVLGNTDKYTYAKSTKTIATGLNGYLKIGNTAEFTPTSDYNPATKKYVDDTIANQPQISFNDSGELVVTINGVSKTFVPKQ